MNAIFIGVLRRSIVLDSRIDDHQPVPVEEGDMRARGDGLPAGAQRYRLLPLAAQPVALDMPSTGIILHRLDAFQSRGDAVDIEPDAVRSAYGVIAEMQ